MAEAMEKPETKSETQPAASETKPVEQRPWHPLLGLRHDIDRLFDEFASGAMRMPFRTRLLDFEPFRRFETAITGAVPTADVAEKDKEFVVTLELPGLDQKDVEIDVTGNMLTIKGEKKEEKEEKAKQYYLSERRYGAFSRSFALPETVDRDKIAAAMKNGVLTITMPKTEAAMRPSRKIDITGA